MSLSFGIYLNRTKHIPLLEQDHLRGYGPAGECAGQ
jgi:hypothetical protein